MTLQTLANQHRNAILAREAQAATQITGQYKATFSRILARLHWLFAQMSSAAHTGEAVNMAWLYQANRLQQALGQISTEVQAFSLSANTTVQGQVSQAQQSGQQDATLLLQHALGKVQGVFNQPSPVAYQALQAGPTGKRFAKLAPDAAMRAKRTLLAGIANGWGPLQIARQLQHDLSIELNAALTISCTATMEAYRAAALQTYQANSDVVTGWDWLAEADACPPICAPQNGSHHDLSETLDSHDRCRCTMLPTTKSYDEILAA